MKKKMFENYGDVNFYDGGCLLKETDTELEYEVITCDFDPDSDDGNHYLLRVGTINLDEIDKRELHEICAFSGLRGVSIDYTDEEWKWLARDAFQYGYRSYDYEEMYLTKNEVIDFINHGYINEIPWEFYEDNFYEDNRNIVVEICDDYLIREIGVFNTLEDALEDFESRAEKGWSLKIIDM